MRLSFVAVVISGQGRISLSIADVCIVCCPDCLARSYLFFRDWGHQWSC